MTTAHIVSHDMGTSLHTELLARQQQGRLGLDLTHSTFTNGSMIKSMAQLSGFQKLLEPPSRVPEAMEVCAAMMPTYVDGLKRLMGRPESVTDETETVMHDVMSYQYGNERIPAVYCYVRERYLHTERWQNAPRTACRHRNARSGSSRPSSSPVSRESNRPISTPGIPVASAKTAPHNGPSRGTR